MRLPLLAAILACAAASGGCLEPDLASDCPSGNLRGLAKEVSEGAILVDAHGAHEGPVWLNVRNVTAVLERTPEGCVLGDLRDVRVGQAVEAKADGPWLEAFPPQTVPSAVVVG